jgi:CDP-diacylglycerol--serine O-phosphatidyltransferase
VGAILLSIQAAMGEGDPIKLYHAAWWLFLASVLDGLDGKVARMTNSMSSLGAQLDSFADAITFGVAPTVMLSTLVFLVAPDLGIQLHPRLLMVAPIIYSCCAILRLARYNIEHESEDLSQDNPGFSGLPSPGAGGLPITMVLLYFGLQDTALFVVSDTLLHTIQLALVWSAPYVTIVLGILMVSRVPYPHFFSWVTRHRSPVRALAEVVVLAGLLMVEPEIALFLSIVLYIFIPPLLHAPFLFRANSEEAAHES